jgi:hypothetical protein
MNAKNMPGFTAEESLRTSKGHYQMLAREGYAGAGDGVVHQLSAARLGGGSGPFSGSCGCGAGFCCCIFCYFNSCYFWCWESGILSPFSKV